MENFLYVLLGAVLSIAGGLLGQRQQQILDQERTEDEVLLEANDLLLKLSGHTTEATPATPEGGHEQLAARFDLLDLSDGLTKCAVRLKRPKNRDVAVRLTKLALDPIHRSHANVFSVTRDVQLRINPDMIRQYERENQSKPTEF